MTPNNDVESLKKQIKKQRDDYLETYPDRGVAEIVAEHLNGVLVLLDNFSNLPLLEQIADLNEKLVRMTERKDYWLDTAGTRGNRLSKIRKHWLELPTIEISYKEGKRLKKWGDKMYKLLGLVGSEEGERLKNEEQKKN